MVNTSHETAARMVDTDCRCHVMIEEVSVETNSRGTSVKCKMSVLGSTDHGQIGKTLTEFFRVDGEAAGMFLNVAEAVGLVSREQRVAAQQSGVGLSIDEAMLKGRQIGVTVKMKPNLRKNPVTGQNEVDPEKPGPYPRVGFDTYSIWDKKAEGIPLDATMAAMMPKPPGYGGSGTAGTPAPQPPRQPTQPSAQATTTSAAGPEMNW